MQSFDRPTLDKLVAALGVDREVFPVCEVLGGEVPGQLILKAWESADVDRPMGVHIHVPFCRSKCAFCRLSSHPPGPGDIEDYLELLARELRMFREVFRRFTFDTLHVGGGTPTLLSADEIHRLLDAVLWTVPLRDDAQVSFEANPSLMGEDRVRALVLRGVNRVSVEVMSFDASVLSRVNRGYQSTEDVRAAVRLLREAGIPNVAMELMAGIPGQSEESFLDSVERAVRMGPDVIQVHRFEAAGSDLARQGLVQTTEDFAEAHRLIRAAEPVLAGAGYGALKGETVYARSEEKVDLHARNRIARCGSVAGFGAYSEGHVFEQIFYAAGDTNKRREALLRREVPVYRAVSSEPEMEMREFMVHNLKAGVDRAGFRNLFGRPVGEVFSSELGLLVENGLVDTDEEGIRPRFGDPPDALVASMVFYPEGLLSELCRLRLGSPYPAHPAGSAFETGVSGRSEEGRPGGDGPDGDRLAGDSPGGDRP